MTLNEYQQQAMTTCLPASNNFSYMALNLVGEVGEFTSKIAKAIRKDQVAVGYIEPNILVWNVDDAPEGFDDELKKEAGDILWQLSGLCTVMGWSLEDVAKMNIDKLTARKKNGTIDGNGDGITKEERK